jgi:hypothetical protein
MARKDIADDVISHVGTPPLHIESLNNGWPSIVTADTGVGKLQLALHVAQVGTHSRKPHEYRFQNPSSSHPIADADGYPILIGFSYDDQPVIIGVDGQSRVGREKRFGILFDRKIIDEASQDGFAKYVSTSGEEIYAFQPKLLPAFAEFLVKGADIPVGELRTAASASGFLDEQSDAAAERTRKAASVLARRNAFGKEVREAYDGCCALCGLGARIIVGAHVHPVSAPDSVDAVHNGLGLCPNHHTAFDNHDIFVDPDDFSVKFSPRMSAEAKINKSVKDFVDQTFAKLQVPVDPSKRPSPEMFRKRYEYYSENYAWSS